VRILVLSFYYRPDLSACSFRSTALVDSLLELAPEGSAIEVITTLPNRYRSFSPEAPEEEHNSGVSISRISLPDHKSGMLDQSRAFVAFARSARRIVAGRDYDVVFATSSRLMTAALGAWITRRREARLYLDIRDIFVETIHDVAPGVMSVFGYRFFSALERWTIQRADRVNLVSPGFEEYFSARYPGKRFSFFTNGIDDEFLDVASGSVSVAPELPGTRPLEVVYAGNVGAGQGLHAIVPEIANRLGSAVQFRIIGDGGLRGALEASLAAAGVTNVEILPPVDREELIEVYRSADILFLHLNDYDAFKKVLPSKFFEYAATGKPIWAGVAGYAAEFVRSEITNSAVFHPCNAEEAVRVLGTLDLRGAPRDDFVQKYARSRVNREMAADLLDLGHGVG
jgi:glycosyltransferase involved in cell wall biosynthesis